MGGGEGELRTDGQTSVCLERSPVVCVCFCDSLSVSPEQKDGNYLLKSIILEPPPPPKNVTSHTSTLWVFSDGPRRCD